MMRWASKEYDDVGTCCDHAETPHRRMKRREAFREVGDGRPTRKTRLSFQKAEIEKLPHARSCGDPVENGPMSSGCDDCDGVGRTGQEDGCSTGDIYRKLKAGVGGGRSTNAIEHLIHAENEGDEKLGGVAWGRLARPRQNSPLSRRDAVGAGDGEVAGARQLCARSRQVGDPVGRLPHWT